MSFDIIRKTTGKASQYAKYVVELYEIRNGKTEQIENALKRLKKDAVWLKENKSKDEILLCFKTDPYTVDYCETITRGAIKILDDNELKYIIRTEDGMRAYPDFEQMERPENVIFISKIVFDLQGKTDNGKLNGNFIEDLLVPIKEASQKGIRTGIEFNPKSDPILSLELIRKFYQIVNQWNVGDDEFEPKTANKSTWKKFKKDTKAKNLFKILGGTLLWTKDVLKINEKDPRLLLIAPHGVATKPQDDINTDKLVIKIAERLNAKGLECSTIVNDVISRLYLDFNKVNEASKHTQFISAIESAVKPPAPTLVVWIHGIGDDNLKKEIQKLRVKKNIQCLIGYGQPGKLTAKQNTVNDLIRLFDANSILANVARNDSSYCGHSDLYMNQWFRLNKYKLKDVESVQLEFKEEGIRKDEDLDEAAQNIAKALSELLNLPISVDTGLKDLTEPEDPLVVEAFEHLKKIFYRHFHKAMLEAGQYLIDKFYGSIDDARNNKKPLLPLIKKLQANSGNAPSKTWVYDAVKLAIDEHDFKDFRTYGNLGHSQKVLLTHVDSNQRKRELVEEAVEGKYTVVKLRERIREIKGKNPLLSDGNVSDIVAMKKLEPPQLNVLRTATQNRINKLYDELSLYQIRLEKISSVINQRDIIEGTDQAAKGGFRDWTEPKNNVNICTGCENDCIYCYAKSMAFRFGQVKEGHWHEMITRQKDVDKKRKLHNGIVGFPSSHDILPTNIDAYLNVLGNLLRSGNEVLVVSKPRLDCIKRICEATQFFKDKVLFRFTIGAINDKILSFWEPNAPTYDERKTCLRYAFHWGFRTSVSMEPMIDSPNIEALVEDLLPFVTEDIWLGTMNHLSRIKKGADKRLLSELETIEAGQTPERLLKIDKIFENHPKIKWKSEALKIIEMAKEGQKNSLLN